MVKVVVHLAPGAKQTVTRCCFLNPRSLPIKDLVTLVPERATCGK